MCMWVKEDVRASCEAVRGDGAVQIRKEACVMCEKKLHNGRIAVLVERGGCVGMVRKY